MHEKSLVVVAAWLAAGRLAAAAPVDGQVGFVSATQAATLMAGGATVLDARSHGYFWGHLPAAQSIDWLDFRDGWGRTGRLSPDVADIARRLVARGVDGQRPVLIYGDAQRGFGEEGRIAWMLAYLGHPRIAILDGGLAAWRQAGQKVVRGLSPRVAPGAHFVPTLNEQWHSDKSAVVQASRDGTPIVDVRSRAEFFGATPYYEARGGHIPGARHLDWQALLDANGRLRPAAELFGLLHQSGFAVAEKDVEAIVYCTGGVRSAFVWSVLRSLGFSRVKNYDGSFWEWAADGGLAVTSVPAPLPR